MKECIMFERTGTRMKKWKKWLVMLMIMLLSCPFGNVEINLAKEQRNRSWREKITNCEVIVEQKRNSNQSISYAGCKMETLTEELFLLKASNQTILENVLNKLEKRRDIVSVQPNYSYTTMGWTDMVNDASANKLWALNNDGTFSYTNDDGELVQAVAGIDIEAQNAWNSYSEVQEVIVAVLDTGVDYNHEDLIDAMWKNPEEIDGNGIDDDGNGYIDDIYGWDFYNNDNTVCSYGVNGKVATKDNDNHGTHCAGTIAATANNSIGIAGVASNINVKIMSIKVLGGVNGGTSTAKLVKGIRYAMSMGVDVINASWGGWIDSQADVTLKKMISHSGILFVAAAGNSGTDNREQKCYPACYSTELDNVISVGSVECDGTLSSFSNYGADIDILAPGSKIYSTVVGNSYSYMSGTSMATPMVTGIAAMLYAGQEQVYPATVKEIILLSYKPLSTLSGTEAAHSGIINASYAVNNRSLLQQDWDMPKVNNLSSDYNGNITIDVCDEGLSGLCGIFCVKGWKDVSYFRHGGKGNFIENDTIKVEHSGWYTFFVRDNAGNEEVQNLYIAVDRTAPVVQAKKKNKKKIVVTVKDKESGVNKVYYAAGKKKISYFQSNKGKKLKIDAFGKTTLKKEKGYFTIYAKDYAGRSNIVTFRIR